MPPMTDRQLTRALPMPPEPASAAVEAPSQELPRPEIAPVIRSKIQPPALRSTTLTRQRLIDRLHEATASRVTLVVAEAGYGKTTLLADFAARSGQRTLWYRLDSTDADAITWTNYLIAACRELMPDFGRATTALLSQVATGGPPSSAVVAALIDEMNELGAAPTLLVLDDFQAAEANLEARELVGRLVRSAPDWLHVVIASRRRPALQLGRLEAMGELVHIGTEELRFSLSETERLFADRFGTPLDAEVLREVDSRTHGWAASLQLFYGSVRGKPSTAIRALAKSLSGDRHPLYDFLAEEVLSSVPAEMDDFLVRAALLDRVVAENVVALFGDLRPQPSVAIAQAWIDEGDRLGLLGRTSEGSHSRQLHPLLRDFLLRRLRQRHPAEMVAAMHLRLARAVEHSDQLMAGAHFLEAGEDLEAMRCLGSSVMLTMGSGQWGAASDLLDRLKGVPADPAVAAIQARRFIEEGDLERAGRLLASVVASNAAPDVRAVFRHAKLSLGWRTGDRALMFETLAEIQEDSDTPAILRDIAQVFIDASPLSVTAVPYSVLARRLENMSHSQALAGHTYYAAISLHNAAIAAFAAGDAPGAVRLCHLALSAFETLAVSASESYSTHAVLAACWFELGEAKRAEEHIELGLSSGKEHGDVHAEFAYLYALVGQRERAAHMLAGADSLRRDGLSDLQGITTATVARAFLSMATAPDDSLEVLGQLARDRPLDVGDSLAHQALECLAHLLAGRHELAAHAATEALARARQHGARNAETRLAIVRALARTNGDELRAAVADAGKSGDLALLEVADAIGAEIDLLVPAPPPELMESMRRWPERWLLVLRRQLEAGPTAAGRAAAVLLDEVGAIEDVSRLRAYAKTYSRKIRSGENLGRKLAERVGPKLEIIDLGRVSLRVGIREVVLSRSRRKAASLLMYLVTRPNFTATREQVLDELWPDADPDSASNSLNQSLYFLRRDVDPWYEDDLSIDYINLEGDLVWLDARLVTVSSAAFLAAVRDKRVKPLAVEELMALVERYPGRFAPEFEYEEWAIGWRQRIHAAYLEFVNGAVNSLASAGALSAARDLAAQVIEIDPDAREIERKLVALYWRLGARSAAAAQFQHLAALDIADGLEPPTFAEVSEGWPQ
jgi:DNA-binding SARP family transcriptional activator